MLHCEYCDYFKRVADLDSYNEEIAFAVCEYSGKLFYKNPEDMGEDYICNQVPESSENTNKG